MTTASKDYPQVAENLFIGFPVTLSYLYQEEESNYPIDLTGKRMRAQLRASRDTTTPVLAEATTENGKITPSYGEFTIQLATSLETSSLAEATYICDIILENTTNNWEPLLGVLFKAQTLSTTVL